MSDKKSSSSKQKSSFRRSPKPKQPLRQAQNKVLAPIYNKVELLRKQLQGNSMQSNLLMSLQLQKQQLKQHFLQMTIDKNKQIQEKRKQYQSQNLVKDSSNENIKKKMSTSCNWRQHNRNRTKSLINFLQNNRDVAKRDQVVSRNMCPSPQLSSLVSKNVENQEAFQPVGEQYFKEKVYQQSIKSETGSVASKQQSSLHLQRIRTASSKDQSKKYLRKGTRVRQILARQLKTPEDRGSSRSSMAYLKQYDQWVPSALVEQKKAQLQSLMSILKGDKKVAGQKMLDMNKLQLIYL